MGSGLKGDNKSVNGDNMGNDDMFGGGGGCCEGELDKSINNTL